MDMTRAETESAPAILAKPWYRYSVLGLLFLSYVLNTVDRNSITFCRSLWRASRLPSVPSALRGLDPRRPLPFERQLSERRRSLFYLSNRGSIA